MTSVVPTIRESYNVVPYLYVGHEFDSVLPHLVMVRTTVSALGDSVPVALCLTLVYSAVLV